MLWLKKRLFLAGFALTTWCASANAAPFTFDFNGAAAGQTFTNVDGLDWSPGNILSVNSNAAIASGVGGTFTSYYQAQLSGLLRSAANGGNVAVPAGTFVTIVAAVNETVTGVAPGFPPGGVSASFDVTGGSYTIYARQGGPAPDNLAGTGFDLGTAIMTGTFTGGVNPFTIADLTDIVTFDQTGANDYPGVNAISGTGSVQANGPVTLASVDGTYFIAPAGFQFDSFTFVGNADSFFNNVDPSMSFANAGFGGVPTIGLLNGTGRDNQFQIDSNQSFDFQPLPPPPLVPEPASIAAFALAMGAGAVGLRRKLKANQES